MFGLEDWGKIKLRSTSKKPVSKALMPPNPVRLRTRRHQVRLKKKCWSVWKFIRNIYTLSVLLLFEEPGKFPD